MQINKINFLLLQVIPTLMMINYLLLGAVNQLATRGTCGWFGKIRLVNHHFPRYNHKRHCIVDLHHTCHKGGEQLCVFQ